MTHAKVEVIAKLIMCTRAVLISILLPTLLVCAIGHRRFLLRARREPGARGSAPAAGLGLRVLISVLGERLLPAQSGRVFFVFSVFYSSGLIGEPRDAGRFAIHSHTKKNPKETEVPCFLKKRRLAG